jgi:integrase/recombinase XerD
MSINISFLALSSRQKSNGQVPIYCYLSMGKEVNRFSTGFYIQSKSWDKQKQKAKGSSAESLLLNSNLEELKKKIHGIQSKFLNAQQPFSASDIISQLKGRAINRPKTLMDVYKHKFEKMNKLLGIDYTKSTLSKYSQMAKAVKEFIESEYHSSDILLSRLDRPFLDDLELFLRTNRGMKPISSNKVIQGLKSIVIYALEREWIVRNPFIGHSFKHVDIEIKYLNKEQILIIENTILSQSRLELVKQLFLFSIYTGLHYADAMALTKSNLIHGADGKQWIEYVRGKTGKRILIPLLRKAEVLLAEFETKRSIEGYLLPRISNQKMNSYLKEIADILNIDVQLTHKIARKTFGSILLFYDVPIKVVSELMGHSNSLITERHYAKLDIRKLGEAISKLN